MPRTMLGGFTAAKEQTKPGPDLEPFPPFVSGRHHPSACMPGPPHPPSLRSIGIQKDDGSKSRQTLSLSAACIRRKEKGQRGTRMDGHQKRRDGKERGYHIGENWGWDRRSDVQNPLPCPEEQ